MAPVQIYTNSITPRLKYACRVLFACVLKVPYHIYITGEREYGDGPAIFYTPEMPENKTGIHIIPSGLLEENGIRKVNPLVTWRHDIPFLFFSQNTNREVFDPLSAGFYMASRYEEYLPFTPDAFGRFPESASLSGKNGFTHLPVVHYWAKQLTEALQKVYPSFKAPETKAEALFTYDIDVAYAYRGRRFPIHCLSFAKDLLSGRFSNIIKKIKSGFGTFSDPSDTYDVLENNPLPTLLFFLMTAKRGTYDRNISPDSLALKALIKRFAAGKSGIGIHPSYLSSEKEDLILSEKKRLEIIANQPVTISRQHFLRFRFPQTFKALEAAGIKHDYSLQYPEMPGFRAGLCVPFPFFNIPEEKETALMLHPGCIMETTFRDDLHLPAAQSLEWYLRLWQQVEIAGGQFISIWHNDTLWQCLPDTHPLAFRQVHNKLVEKFSAISGRKSQSLPGSNGSG